MAGTQGVGGLRVLRFRVFDVLRFVEHGSGEMDFAQSIDVASQQCVARDDHVGAFD